MYKCNVCIIKTIYSIEYSKITKIKKCKKAQLYSFDLHSFNILIIKYKCMKNTIFKNQDMNTQAQQKSLQSFNNVQKYCYFNLQCRFNLKKILYLVVFMSLIEETKTYKKCQIFQKCTICQVQSLNCTYQNRVQDGDDCWKNCCDDIMQKKQSKFIENCEQYQKDETNLNFLVFIAMGVCASIIVLAICICCYYHHYCKQRRGIPWEEINRDRGVNSVPNSAQNLIFQEIQLKQLREFQNKQNNIKSSLMNPTEICSICLQKSTQIMTSCNHYFHIDCFGKWLNKNNRCPLCNGLEDRFNPVIIYCRQCNYRVLGVKIGRNKGNIDTLLQKYKQTVCSVCKE